MMNRILLAFPMLALSILVPLVFGSCRRTPMEPNLTHERAQGYCAVGSCR